MDTQSDAWNRGFYAGLVGRSLSDDAFNAHDCGSDWTDGWYAGCEDVRAVRQIDWCEFKIQSLLRRLNELNMVLPGTSGKDHRQRQVNDSKMDQIRQVECKNRGWWSLSD